MFQTGIAWSNGDSWKEMRRFALKNLKDFGMGKKICEEMIIQECQFLIQEFMKFKGNTAGKNTNVSSAEIFFIDLV